MNGLDGVSSVDGGAYIVRVLEVSRQGWPLVPPGFNHHGVFLAPFGFQLIQGDFGGIERFRFIDRLQIGHERLLVLGSDVFHGVADLVDDAVLDFGVGVDRFDGFGEAFEAVHAGDQDIFDASVVEVSEHAQPMMSAFLVREIEAEQLFPAFDVQVQKGVDGLADIAAIFFDFVVNGVKLDDRVNGLQVALPPGLQLGQQLVGDRADCPIGEGQAVQAGNVGTDILVAVAQGKQGKDLALKFVGEMGLVLLDDLRLEGARPVPWGFQFKATSGRLDGLAAGAVLAIGGVFLGKGERPVRPAWRLR